MLENQFVDVNKVDHNGVNSFWVACYCGNAGVMKVLAESGVDIFNTDERGYTVLHLAAKKNLLNIVKLLINSNYPLDVPTNKGQTAL